ncbi:MAG: hypothetical protein LBT43_19040, partial [Prevotella sp.]|nr:hypothetical protein [Prevotella sp.]
GCYLFEERYELFIACCKVTCATAYTKSYQLKAKYMSDMSDFNKISESLRIPLYNQKLIELSGYEYRETEGKTLQFLCYSIAEPLR